MYRISKFFLMSFVAVLFFSCGSDETSDLKIHDVTFLNVGTHYDFYERTLFFEDSIRIVIEEQLAKDTFLVRSYSDAENIFPTQYYVLKDNILYVSIRLRDPDTYQIECKFNKPVGTSWQVNKNSIIFTYRIEAVDIPLATGKGVVSDAIKIKVTSPTGVSVSQYISPSVGFLGTGPADDETTQLALVDYTIGNVPHDDSKRTPSITFGDFPFLKIGNYWKYDEYDFFSGDDELTLLVESKVPSHNIYKVKMTYTSTGSSSYAYWYEDNGELKVYEEGENYLNADIIYVNEAQAVIGHGWGSQTSDGITFFYKIQDLNETVDTYWGSLSCTNILVSDGLFSSQNNYWNKNKGNVLVEGLIGRDVTDSNVRAGSKPFIPIISY